MFWFIYKVTLVVIATSDEEAIQKAQNYSTSKITIISCTKYA